MSYENFMGGKLNLKVPLPKRVSKSRARRRRKKKKLERLNQIIINNPEILKHLDDPDIDPEKQKKILSLLSTEDGRKSLLNSKDLNKDNEKEKEKEKEEDKEEDQDQESKEQIELTETEKRFKHSRKNNLKNRLFESAKLSHREKVSKYNEKLEKQSDFFDLQKV
ncbi:hypothetical protein M0812_01901 [Anaeramoeba flamelloides]|uniref:Uncharacterized protein n=1 Tax=Anaeramoeba flamelloides TaxID=1746091 RepID=A0AAV7Z163_9EUKA|nr:hypothetical protein M0812_01901 [Anaeramoeba flamelloides]